jgi:hypothetical protein
VKVPIVGRSEGFETVFVISELTPCRLVNSCRLFGLSQWVLLQGKAFDMT